MQQHVCVFCMIDLHFLSLCTPFLFVSSLSIYPFFSSTQALGYSTKVHFNACCKPSPLFDPHKVLTKLPFSIGPGHLADTLQVVLQTLLDLCLDPVAALELIPAAGVGPLIVAHTSDGDVASKHIIVPSKLSEYWLQLYEYSNKLQCCENFFSATQPSVPCLICHPFGE